MSTGQVILTMVAFAFLSTILLGFYQILGNTGEDISSGQDGILATTLTTSYMELAQGLAFDDFTDTSDMAIRNVNLLTNPSNLGPEQTWEDSIHKFNDFDDFNNFSIEREAGGTTRRYRTEFKVHYVNPANVSQVSTLRTFVKRMDLKTWRVHPPPLPSTRLDTVRMSLVMGYFHFD
jgi:hypothetical protein